MMLSARPRNLIRRCSTLPAARTTRPRLWEIGIAPRSWKLNLTCIRGGNTRKFRAMFSTNEATAERGAWRTVLQGWHQLYGDFDRLGISVEWHDFKTERPLDWGLSF